MTYRDTLDYLFSKLPMYQRIGKAAYRNNLDNTVALCKLLGNPEKKFKSVHIAGTNGKGSVAHILSSILQEAGCKTGLYTSPHLKDFRERIRIDGKMIRQEEVVQFVNKYKKSVESIQPSFFEWTVGLAFHHFATGQVDIAILETGMGGRLDSTNVATPMVSVITNIGSDHRQFLGNTLEKIAIEKAGIIKKGIPVVVGETQQEVAFVFRERAAELYFADKLMPDNRLQTDLAGSYQRKNIKTALQTVEVLKSRGFNITRKHIENGLGNVVRNTGLSGRWQTLSNSPLTICDIGHNKEGIVEVLANISSTPHKQLHIAWGMVNDKDAEEILRMLPIKATYYFCKADVPRGLNAEKLKVTANRLGLAGNAYPSVKKAVQAARQRAAEEDLVFIGGSAFVVAEVV